MMWKKILIFTILIGVIGVAINMVFGNSTIAFLEKQTYNGQTFYKYDFWNYVLNIKANFSNPSELTLTWQNTQWVKISGNILQADFWQDLGNNLAYILNTIIFVVNIILYPIRISMYVGRTALSLIGVNITGDAGGLQWLVDTCNFLIQLQIPYVQNS